MLFRKAQKAEVSESKRRSARSDPAYSDRIELVHLIHFPLYMYDRAMKKVNAKDSECK